MFVAIRPSVGARVTLTSTIQGAGPLVGEGLVDGTGLIDGAGPPVGGAVGFELGL